MEISVAQQFQQFFLSCGLGFLLGVYYDIYRVIRLVLHSKKGAVFVQDMLFFLTSAVITFLFSLAVMDGHLRFYLFLGEGIGFFAYYHTIGRLVMKFAGAVIAVVVRVWSFIWRVVFFPFRLVARLFRKPYSCICEFSKKILQKWTLNLKKVLKRVPSLLYNHKKDTEQNGLQSNVSRLHRRGKRKHEGR